MVFLKVFWCSHIRDNIIFLRAAFLFGILFSSLFTEPRAGNIASTSGFLPFSSVVHVFDVDVINSPYPSPYFIGRDVMYILGNFDAYVQHGRS